MKKYDTEILAVHNNFRRVHNSPLLVLDKQMSEEAQEWASKLAEKGELKHNKDNKDGENLYMACVPKGRALKPWRSVVAWYVNSYSQHVSKRLYQALPSALGCLIRYSPFYNYHKC